MPGPLAQNVPQQGSARLIRQNEFKPSSVKANNEFERTNAIKAQRDLRDSAWVSNPNLGKQTGGVRDHRDSVTIDDYLGMQREKLKTDLGYQGAQIAEVGGKEYKGLSSGQQLAAQHNTLLDQLMALDADMYGDLDSGGPDGKSDGRVTWGEAGSKTKQKGARAAFESVHGRAPTNDDTFTPNIDAYLNLAGVKELDLYTAKDAQDMVNDLYLTTGEVEELDAGADDRLNDKTVDRIDVANSLYQGLRGLQGTFVGSEGVAVTVGDDRGTSELDITAFDDEQRANLAMIIGTSILEEDPEVLFALNEQVGKKLNGLNPLTRTDAGGQETSVYAAPGMGGLDLSTLADPRVRAELEAYRKSLDAVMSFARDGGADEQETFKLLAGQDLKDVKAAEFLEYIDKEILPKTGGLKSSQLRNWIERQNMLDEAARTKADSAASGPVGIGGDATLRDLLYSGGQIEPFTPQTEKKQKTEEKPQAGAVSVSGVGG